MRAIGHETNCVDSHRRTVAPPLRLVSICTFALAVAACGGGGGGGGGGPSPDKQAPTAPEGLAASVVSATQVNLSWTAATDNVGVTGYLVERCQGAGCTSFAQVGTTTTMSYSDGALASGTSYGYRVRARDAANNLGPYSSTASATTPADTQAPTAPGRLSATVASSSQVNLSWTAATDNVGVSGYLVERCQGAGCSSFAQVGTTTTTTYGDTGLAASASYSYRVRAKDAANNLGPYSPTTSVVTTVDSQPPTEPSSVNPTATSATQIDLSWTAATDNVGVTGYVVSRCQDPGCSDFVQIGTPTTTSFSDTALVTGGRYVYTVQARDAAGNVGAAPGTQGTSTFVSPVTQSRPNVLAESHSATEGQIAANNTGTITLNVTGPNTLIIAAWHSEYDGGSPNDWSVTCNGVAGTEIVNSDGYTGGAGNQRFRIYYWRNPPPGPNSIVVTNSYSGPNELAVAAVLLNNVSQTTPLGAVVQDVSASNRTGESETVSTVATDLVVHVIADGWFTRGALSAAETLQIVANDNKHQADGDASLVMATAPGLATSTTVSSSNWPAGRVVNGVAIAVHGP